MPYYQPGTYTVAITAQGLNESKAKRTPGFFLTVIPKDDQYERTIQWWITEGTVDNVLRDLRKLGFAGESWAQLDPETDGYHNFVGQVIEAVCKHEEHEGKTYERWELPYEGKPREVLKLDKKGARRLDTLFGKQFKSAFSGAPKPEPLTAANMKQEAAKAQAEGDEIPF